MTHAFEVRKEIELDATPEQVWQAIATGPGIDSWFMGHSEIEPEVGGKTTMFLGAEVTGRVTAWQPGKHFAYRSDENPEDHTFMAFEYLLEARDQGSTVLRFVHSGFLGDDWQEEYDALQVGDGMYLRKLAVYLARFVGRFSTFNMFVPAPGTVEPDRAWSAFREALTLTGEVKAGDRTLLAVPGLPGTVGVVEFVDPAGFIGVSSDDGIHMFVHGMHSAVVEYHAFTTVDSGAVEATWQGWMARTLA